MPAPNMRIVARVLGQLLLAVSSLWGIFGVALLVNGDRTAALGSFVLAGIFAIPGGLLHHFAQVASRRLRAEELIRTRAGFTIDEVAAVLHSTPDEAHAFIAQTIAANHLELAYQQGSRSYTRRGRASRPDLPPPPPGPAPQAVSAPCPACGSSAVPTETGFCPTCGARADPSRAPRVRG